ncbi:unnamed protein product [Ilex paraguariensis]|uniref:Lysine-specific demethylase 5B n=1 Tax=Ilex paraguariensis TaxID=185542 RepID=A0ABC8RGS0_9AQUA
MGKGRPRAVEKGVLGQSGSIAQSELLKIPPGPVYYPTEEEFKDPLEFIYKIRPEAEPYGICKIVPPKSWKPPFTLDLNSFTFPTKTQAIHQLQARSASCDSKTFELEYNRFLEEHCGRKFKKKVVFEGEELDLCKLFNAVKRFGGYDKVVNEKKWGEVFRFVKSVGKITECAKHVLCQLYREHLYDYEGYYNQLNPEKYRRRKRGMHCGRKNKPDFEFSNSKRRRKNYLGQSVEACKFEEKDLDQICEQCRSGLHGDVMLLCDRCNKGWHIYCLSPPVKQVPPGNWYCLECLNSEKDCFGFVPGKQFPLEDFRRMADRAKKKYFGSVSPSRVQLEKKFWEIVEGSVGEVKVMYGSDLDTSVYGSGFPRINDQRPISVGVEIWDEYCASPWNLNNLPKLPGSMLRAVHNSIAGVMVPWLYIGMLFSSFCWHFEDHCFYSMNYLHWGEPKCWYSVPGNEASAFEKVMRDSLPDLFDAQPDLLFQLVTMLNPSVLQENRVPVYSVLQEPGNFVITFPRSYHGGFNFGLNCAEAVNFAPADWLPHGGFGAERYQLYRKAAVLSHEELIYVVAKSDFDSKASPYLKKELLRIFDKEKTWRNQLWRNGIVNSSLMPPRKQPEYVGTEEDPTCIICQQFLYLSAVVCRCRPSSFVCLEHWEHLCECKPKKHRLLYRHTLAELSDLVLRANKHNSETVRDSRRQLLCSNDSAASSKKLKGRHVTHTQLAEEWLLTCCKILQNPYSSDAYTNALKEAEQFLWAGSEMDPVRDMAKNLIEAKKWAEDIRDCLSKVELWKCDSSDDVEKVQMEHVNNLLSFDPLPCNEPGHLKLKAYEQEARVLIQEMNPVLSTCSKASIADLEVLYSKAFSSPIFVQESEKLLHKLSSAKVWVDTARKCISVKFPATVEADILYKLESEILELQVQVPEAEMLLDLIKQAESCRSRCNEMLKGSICLKKLELLLLELDGFPVKIPELELLRQYHTDAESWVSRVNDVLVNLHNRDDQENVVDELQCIKRDGELLKIRVDVLPFFEDLEVDLKKALCRVKARKVLRCKMSLDFIQTLLREASLLQVEKEKLFAEISGLHAVGICWEEKAKHILASEAQMSDFEDLLRTSKDICAILPSLDDVKDAISMAKSWLNKSKPFLVDDIPVALSSSSLLKVDALKDLVSQSKLLKISLRERSTLQTVLNNCLKWEQDACSLLHDAESLLIIENVGDGISSGLLSRIEHQVAAMESALKAILSLGFDLGVIPKLQDACSMLQWCFKALSFCAIAPALEEVEMLLEVTGPLPAIYKSCSLWSSLVDGLNWLKNALEISVPCNLRRFKLSDVEEVCMQSQTINISFPVMVSRLLNAIKRHHLWLEQVHLFFCLNSRDRSWVLLLELKELGSTDAYNCSELDMVSSEVQKVEHWKQRFEEIAGPSVGDHNSNLNVLLEIKSTLDRSLYIYDKSKGREPGCICILCCNDIKDQELLTCSLCMDCFHLGCSGSALENTNDAAIFICPFCHCAKKGKISRNGSGLLRIGGKQPELNDLIELLSLAEDLCIW